jgi:putative inorganic carbon (HCO3(-)) transporter
VVTYTDVPVPSAPERTALDVATEPRLVRRAAVLGGLFVTVLVGSLLVVVEPVAAGLGLVGLLVVGVLMLRIAWTVLCYVAVEPFGDLVGGVVPEGVKLVGLLLFAAWLVRVLVDRRPVALRHPVVVAAGVLGTVVLAAFTLNPNGGVGVETAGRYGSYLAVLVVLVDTMRTTVPPRRVATVFLVACSGAALVGLVGFLTEGGRAAGPMQDANDFAFYLVCALPFALLLWRDARGWARVLPATAVVLLVVTVCATFSRGALLGIAVMVVVALALGLLRLRDLGLAAAAVALGLGIVAVSVPDLVERSLAEKEFVADANVESRYTSWTLAAEMTLDHPVLGTGPGGFGQNFDAYDAGRSSNPTHLDVVHMMYLDVSSELGLVGLAAFLGLLVTGAGAAWRARAADGRDPGLASAVCVALSGTLAAATFLSEQYYLPVWLLLALAAAVSPMNPTTPTRRS